MTTLPVEYVRNGWVLVPIAAGTKGPTEPGWNLLANCVADPAGCERVRENVGLAHAYSGTCAIDFDDLDESVSWFSARGVDARALLSAPDAVRISSGRPNRAKLLYRMVTPLRSFKVSGGPDESRTILEFRCATSKGTTVQDVLPPSIHPITQQPYAWEYGDELVGDWRSPPTIPDALLTLWQSTVRDTHEVSAAEDTRPRMTRAQLEVALATQSPDAEYHAWLRAGMACHYESAGAPWGLEVWDAWSQRSPKYKGTSDLRQHWRTFISTGERLVTAASFRRDEPATADDFDDLTLLPQPEFEAPTVGAIPEAQHLCTDQANAQRIARVFGNRLLSCAGRFYHYTGTRWVPDEGEAQRCASNLSKIVGKEARRAREKAERAFAALAPELVQAAAEHPVKNKLDKTESGADAMKLLAAADALVAWGTRCEFKAVQDAAIGLLRKLLSVDASALDRDPWALNCLSGTIDLRTGSLRAHAPADYITRLAPVEYDPSARAPKFRAFVASIMGGDTPRAEFLQRWFGYCATGDVREQKLICHIGAGANGKGTLLNAVQDVMGDYVGTAAPGLLTTAAGSERHPTEIADLFGKRMVTAHESDDAAVLREGFVKQATGGDKLKARWMRADFFEFYPTHKLQLLTNHRPSIKGQDYGIWRRILLVPYGIRYGSLGEIEAGRADSLRDDALAEALRAERTGILTWIVEGAVAWHGSGLQPPDTVLAASREYQTEQDRTAQFIAECCRLDAEAWAPYSGIGGLYPAYQKWAKESGYSALGKGRFIGEITRCVPFFKKAERKVGEGKTRRTVDGARGIAVVDTDFSDLL